MVHRTANGSPTPRSLGAQRWDTAPARLAFLIVQSPNGECRRFLFVFMTGIVFAGALLWLLAILVSPARVAWLLTSAIPIGVGTSAIRRRQRNRKT